ncbi:hypothetical protein TNCV_248741, partial [Trichonephila clavipes]
YTLRRLAESQEFVSEGILSKEDFASTFENDFKEAETYRDRSERRTKSFVGKIWFDIDDISKNKTEQSHRYEDVKTLPTSAALVSTGSRSSDTDLLLGADAIGFIYTGKLIKVSDYVQNRDFKKVHKWIIFMLFSLT